MESTSYFEGQTIYIPLHTWYEENANTTSIQNLMVECKITNIYIYKKGKKIYFTTPSWFNGGKKVYLPECDFHHINTILKKGFTVLTESKEKTLQIYENDSKYDSEDYENDSKYDSEDYEEEKVNISNKRTKISKRIQTIVWENTFGKEYKGLCPCCEKNTIDVNTRHISHKKAIANGGSDNIENLIPLCSSCNLSMGTKDYHLFKRSLQSSKTRTPWR